MIYCAGLELHALSSATGTRYALGHTTFWVTIVGFGDKFCQDHCSVLLLWLEQASYQTEVHKSYPTVDFSCVEKSNGGSLVPRQ